MAGATVPPSGGPSWWHRAGSRRLSRGFILAGALAVGWCAKGAVTVDDTSSRPVAEGRQILRWVALYPLLDAPSPADDPQEQE